MHIPGHTTGHICFYFPKNKIVFTGDTLFSLGCGRIFEGNYKQMFISLKLLEALPDETIVYCGHEYTEQNYNFLLSIFHKNDFLNKYKLKIDIKIKKYSRSIPFNLGEEKIVNPFLTSDISSYSDFIKSNNFNKFDFFKHIRNLKDNY